MRYILASRSPRRKELLSKILPDFEIIVRDTDETLPVGTPADEGVRLLAIKKGEAVMRELPSDCLIISSDTLVELDGVHLGKPSDEADAVRTLMSLSGREHNVHTGVAVHYRGRVYSGCDTSHVKFKEFTEKDAWDYVATGEPMDKAGSYAIQGLGGRFVEGYTGGFDVIVGLGLALTEKLIKRAIEDDEK